MSDEFGAIPDYGKLFRDPGLMEPLRLSDVMGSVIQPIDQDVLRSEIMKLVGQPERAYPLVAPNPSADGAWPQGIPRPTKRAARTAPAMPVKPKLASHAAEGVPAPPPNEDGTLPLDPDPWACYLPFLNGRLHPDGTFRRAFSHPHWHEDHWHPTEQGVNVGEVKWQPHAGYAQSPEAYDEDTFRSYQQPGFWAV